MVTFRKPQKTGGAAIKPISDSEKHHISPRNDAFHTSIKPVSYYNKARFARRSGLYFYPVLLKTLYANGLCKPSKTRVFAAGSTVGRKYRRIFELCRIFIHFSITHSVYLYTPCSVFFIHAPSHAGTAFTSAPRAAIRCPAHTSSADADPSARVYLRTRHLFLRINNN